VGKNGYDISDRYTFPVGTMLMLFVVSLALISKIGFRNASNSSLYYNPISIG
jgi:hypothetical protein